MPRFERREARRPTPPWIAGLGGVRQLGFSSTAPLVLPVALATIWPLLLIAVASWIVGDPAGIRVLRFCTVPPLSMYGPLSDLGSDRCRAFSIALVGNQNG